MGANSQQLLETLSAQIKQLEHCVNRLSDQVSKLEKRAQASALLSDVVIPAENNDTPSANQREIRLQQQQAWFNQMMESNKQALTPEYIEKHTKQWGAMQVIDFANQFRTVDNYQNAEFRENPRGRCFILPYREDESGTMVYAAFPYPLNRYWYERGKAQLDLLYNIAGSTQSMAPTISITSVALVASQQGPTNAPDDIVYIPYRRGYLYVSD